MAKGKRVNIELSLDTHTKAKLIAVLGKKRLQDYLAQVIDEAVKRDKKLLEEVIRK